MDNCPWQGLSPIFGQYGANGEIIGKPSLGLPAIDAPASTLLAFDAGAYIVNADQMWKPCGFMWYIPGSQPNQDPLTTSCSWGGGAIGEPFRKDFSTGRHSNGINAAYADGHVKWSRGTTLYDQKAKPWCPRGVNPNDPWHCQ
jgi:prepilin-type processing-associated H-X9-DG protein